MPVALPPLQEQMEIGEEIERITRLIVDVEINIARRLEQAKNLRQSILKQAFSGKLVSQDIQDQPAAAFAEEVQAEIERIKKVENAQQLKLF